MLLRLARLESYMRLGYPLARLLARSPYYNVRDLADIFDGGISYVFFIGRTFLESVVKDARELL